LARQLGANRYIDASSSGWEEELKKLGGARLALATAPDSKAISALFNGLAPNGKIVLIAAPGEPLAVNATQLLLFKQSIAGWYSGTAMDSEDTLRFSVLAGVHPMTEQFPLAKVADAYERMISGKARFRVVLTMGE